MGMLLFYIGLGLIVVLVCGFVFFTIYPLVAAAVAIRKQPECGKESFVGEVAEAITSFETVGKVCFRGAIWEAKCSEPVEKGAEVRIVGVEETRLIVEPV